MAPPKGTTYNKNAILGMLVIILLAFGVAILFSLSTKKSGNSKMILPGEQPVSGTQDLTPAGLNKLPDSYGRIGDDQSPNNNGANFSKQPGISGQEGYLNSNTFDQTGTENGRQDTSQVLVPPTVQPLPTGQPTVSGDWSNSGQPELSSASKSPIRFGNEISSTSLNQKTDEGLTGDFNKLTGQLPNQNGYLPAFPTQPGSDQNLQDEKIGFNRQNSTKQAYASALLTPPLSPYELKAGSIVPVVLVTGLNSDLPGNLIAQVRENVYDTVTGKYLLVPQGTKVIGVYDSRVAYAREPGFGQLDPDDLSEWLFVGLAKPVRSRPVRLQRFKRPGQ